jgi:prephenate dehydrogenase
MVDMPIAAPPHVREDILKRNVGELQEQLQRAYIRIKELTEELEREKSKTS